MKYYNYLTTPSGEYCTLNEITNEEYMLLLKFIESDNKVEVFRVLDGYIKETIPNFDEFDIINKAYIYIAFIFYNIKATVSVQSEKMGQQEVGLEMLLNNLEQGYSKGLFIECDINDSISIICSYPKSFYIENNEFQIDYSSAIQKIKKQNQEIVLSLEESKQLCKNLPSKDQIILSDLVENNIKNDINLMEGLPFFKIQYNSVSADTLGIVYQLLKEDLEGFYNKVYLMCHYAKFSRADFMQMTPHEAHIILNQFIKDKEEQAERQKELTNKVNG